MKDISYHKPITLEEALTLKRELGPGAHYISGGTDVMVLRRQRKLDPTALISLLHVGGLAGLRWEGEVLRLGAATTLCDILADRGLHERLPALTDAVRVMGSTQMRNVATMGGNVMSAAPSGDTLCPLLCLGASCRLVGEEGERLVPLDEFFVGPRQNAARPEEILTELVVPLPGPRSSGAFIKLTRRAALDLALLNMAVQLWLSPDGARLEKARVAAGVVAPTPLRLCGAEEALTGQPATTATLERAAQAIGGECSPRDSHRCSAWYREEMLRVLLVRAASTALARLGLDFALSGPEI